MEKMMQIDEFIRREIQKLCSFERAMVAEGAMEESRPESEWYTLFETYTINLEEPVMGDDPDNVPEEAPTIGDIIEELEGSLPEG